MPQLPRIGPGEVVPLVRVRADDVGGGAGQAAYAGAASDVGAVSARLIGAEREGEVARAEVGYAAKLAELAQTVDQNPDADAREQQYEEGRKALSEEFRGSIRGAQYQGAFDQRAFQLGERTKLSVREGVIRKRLDNARGGVIEAVDKFDRLIEHSESDQLTKGYIFARSNILDAGVAGGSISAAERAQIEEGSRKALEESELRRSSQQSAAALASEHPGNLSAQLRDARETIQDPKKLELVEARLKTFNDEKRNARSEFERQQRNDLTRRFHLPDGDPNKLTREQVIEDPTIEAGTRDHLIAGFDAKTKAGGEVKTDWKLYYDRVSILTDPRRKAEAAKYDPMADLGVIAPAQMDDLVKFKRGEFDKQEVKVNTLLNQRVRTYLGLRSQEIPSEEQTTTIDLYRIAANEEIEAERVAKGRVQLTDEEITDALDRSLANVSYPGTVTVPFTDIEFHTGMVYSEPRFNVPQDDYLEIREELRGRGVKNPTDRAIRDVYTKRRAAKGAK